MLKVFGYILPKLPDGKKWIDVNAVNPAHYSRSPYLLDVETAVDPACHLYEDASGNQIVGFEIFLGIPKEEMCLMLNNAAEKKIYTVLEF